METLAIQVSCTTLMNKSRTQMITLWHPSSLSGTGAVFSRLKHSIKFKFKQETPENTETVGKIPDNIDKLLDYTRCLMTETNYRKIPLNISQCMIAVTFAFPTSF